MDVVDAIRTRRSVRAFTAEEPDRAIIEAVIQDAAHAPPPTIRTQTSWLFSVVTGQAKIAAFGESALEHARRHRPPTGGAWIDDPEFKVFWGAPALIVICGRSVNPDAKTDCHRAGQNLMLSAHARGLGTCWVGSPLSWLQTTDAKAALGIPPEYDAVAPIVIGYARETQPVRHRESPDIRWN